METQSTPRVLAYQLSHTISDDALHQVTGGQAGFYFPTYKLTGPPWNLDAEYINDW